MKNKFEKMREKEGGGVRRFVSIMISVDTTMNACSSRF